MRAVSNDAEHTLGDAMMIRIIAVLFALSSLASCVSLGPSAEPSASEWFPTIGVPTPLEGWQRQEVLAKCGLNTASQIWTRTADLDHDGKEDCVVTVSLPEESGARWTNNRSLTYVFRGVKVGAFGGRWRTATLWFSLVTYEEQRHVEFGDSQTIRQFSLVQRDGLWFVHVSEHEYGNDGGEAKDRLMRSREARSWTKPITDLPPASQRYP